MVLLWPIVAGWELSATGRAIRASITLAPLVLIAEDLRNWSGSQRSPKIRTSPAIRPMAEDTVSGGASISSPFVAMAMRVH
jgi:hypothetical protein